MKLTKDTLIEGKVIGKGTEIEISNQRRESVNKRKLEETITEPFETREDFFFKTESMINTLPEPSGGYPYSVDKEARGVLANTIDEKLDNNDYGDYSEVNEFDIEMEITTKDVRNIIDDHGYADLNQSEYIEWLSEGQKGRTYHYVDEVLINGFSGDFDELMKEAYTTAILWAVEMLGRSLSKVNSMIIMDMD